jgi:TolB-like protein/DNA-binding SARP family transcriptional activator
MAILKLQLLGGFRAQTGSGQEVVVQARKGRALLAILSLSPAGGMSREKLATLLWSDRGEEQARSSLRQTLTTLRKELAVAGANLLIADDFRVELLRDAVDIDAVSIVSFSHSTDVTLLRRAVDLYHGEFLAEAAVNDPVFEEWLTRERSRINDVMILILDRLLTLERADERVALAKRLVALDPLREASNLALMQAFADVRERAMALQHYAAFKDLLKSELNVQPGQEVEQFRLRLSTEGHSALPKPQSASPKPATQGADSNIHERPSIAVLPFTNIGGDPGQQYLSDGITDDIIIQLSRFHELKVTARTAAFTFQGDNIDSGAAARALGARYIVKGTVRVGGNRLIISCQLLEAETENLLWGERYDRAATDIFSVQDEVVARIVTALGGQLVTAGVSAIRRKPTENWTAYDYFLKGRDLCNLGREEASEPFFTKAVELDPDFALAHAWRGIGLMGKFWYLTDHSFASEALASGERALELDPNEAMAHHATGTALDYLRKYDRSEFHLRRAAGLNPLDVNISADYANLLLHTDRHDEALALIEEVLQRDAYPPPWIRYTKGKILFFNKRFEDAINTLDNGSVYTYKAHGFLAAAHAILGNLAEARRHIGLMRVAKPDVSFESFVVTMPFADPASLDFFRDALRKAGFED